MSGWKVGSVGYLLSFGIWLFAAAAPALVGTVQGGERPGKPNILIVLADDLGYGDLGCYGHPTIRTPHLDRLAKSGLRCTQGYAASTLCSPSRAGLLTGRNPTRSGVYSWISAGNPMHLPASEITLATLLKGIGYVTAHVGKWHLNGMFNSPKQPQPGDHGFDHWFATQNNASPSHANPKNFVRNGKEVGPLKGFSSQLVADEAIGWLKEGRKKDAPFFLFVCFHEPHEPVASPADLVESYPKAKNENEAQYFANVTNMDRAVGRLLDALDELKLADNTIVLFTSDNGPETLNRYRGAQRSYGSQGRLRGRKLWMYEGGIRVPMLLRWPGKTRPGQTSDEPICSLDLLPTLCRATGAKTPGDRPIDGSDFHPLFEGKKIERKTPLFWHYYRALGEPKIAMREGNWVVLGCLDRAPKGAGGSLQPGDLEVIRKGKLVRFELYDLSSDELQEKDRSREQPERLARMSERLRRLYAEIVAEGPTFTFGKKAGK